MPNRVVTYKGATPAGGISTALQVEDEDGNRVVFVQDEPQEVDEKFAKLAADVEHHEVEVETVDAFKKRTSSENGDEG